MAKILVVDDNEQNCELMRDILVTWGYDVYQAFQGTEAIDCTLRYLPDAILLDVMLPGLNGFEVCRELKEDARTRNIPIVMLSVLTDVEDRIRGFKVGADNFLSKPVNYYELRYRLACLIKQKQLLDVMECRDQVVTMWLTFMQLADPGLYNHVCLVHDYCQKVAGLLMLPKEQTSRLLIAAQLHDIGKLVTNTHASHQVNGAKLVVSLNIGVWLAPLIAHHHDPLPALEQRSAIVQNDFNELEILVPVNRFVNLRQQLSRDDSLAELQRELTDQCVQRPVIEALQQIITDEEFIQSFQR
jgi:putative two-component system response regulator